MRLTETIETGVGPVTVRELTVGEVRHWLASIATGVDLPSDVVGNLMFDGFAIEELTLFLIGKPDYDALTQSEVHAIHAVAKRLNPDFFIFRQRLFRAGQTAAESTESAASPTSNAISSG